MLTRRKNVLTPSDSLTCRLEGVEAQIADVISADRKRAGDWGNVSVRLATIEESLKDLRVQCSFNETRLDIRKRQLNWITTGLIFMLIVVAGLCIRVF